MAEEQTKAPETPAQATPPADAAPAKKNKKVNRLLPDELNKTIADLESRSDTKSRYYRHLLARREEMTKAQV